MSRIESSHQERLESLFRRYSYLPKEAVIKEDILTGGLSAAASVRRRFSKRALCLEGGLYGLRRTIVRAEWRQDSPYILESRDGQLTLVDRASRVSLASARPFPETPAGLDHCWDVVAPDGEVAVSPDVGPARVAAAVAEVFNASGWSPREKPLHISISFDDTTEEDACLACVRGIKGAVENRYPLLLQMAPQLAPAEQRLWQEGVNGRLSDLEVWDQRLFATACPGKEKAVGWDEWVRRMLDQVYTYGEGRVLTRLVIGLEMRAPHGFSDLSEAVKSTSEGFQFLMSHGIIPLPIHMTGARGRRLPVELFLETDRAWYETWYFYRMCEPTGFNVGPGRNRFPDSAAFDVGRGAELDRRAVAKE